MDLVVGEVADGGAERASAQVREEVRRAAGRARRRGRGSRAIVRQLVEVAARRHRPDPELIRGNRYV